MEYDKIIKKRKEIQIFTHNAKDKDEYRRLITTFGNTDKSNPNFKGKPRTIEDEQYMLDQIELNAMMDPSSISIELEQYSGTFILLSYIAMYSFICPSISCMIFIHNMVAMKPERWAHFQYILRKPILHINNLSYFNSVIEILSNLTILMNCIFLFWFREDF